MGRAIAFSIVGMTALIAICDLVIFRSILPANYVATFGGPHLSIRIATYMVMAVGEEIIFRLLAMSAIAWCIERAIRKPMTLPWILLTAGLAQGLNMLRIPMPHDASEFAYDAIRFWSPGLVWGWLYWRHGFVSNVAAHAGTHVILQPLLWIGLHY